MLRIIVIKQGKIPALRKKIRFARELTCNFRNDKGNKLQGQKMALKMIILCSLMTTLSFPPVLFALVRSEENPYCTVTQHHDEFVYEIVGDSSPPSSYQWVDSKDISLVDDMHPNKSDLHSNWTHLVTKTCMEGIYRRKIKCFPLENCTVNCNVNCNEISSAPVTEVSLSGGQIAGIVIAVIALVVVVLLVYCFCCKEDTRNGGFKKTKQFYEKIFWFKTDSEGKEYV
ncbi:uncharacterized protein LOC130909950 isoform X2 [Corythoichthys intestinalis]|uniref:uncharacterized protein LOC130909950 isoform X2 n=1 Tax=Corythoichthys intestinalis TaxID=161448 RepID=UPI0025A64116|nr:uncharacterized protein LOC130909950 isoform X2 [Corythoichthys intestinalis]